MAKGYIALHRKIWESDIWKSKEPFDMRSAWIDLLLMANHADKQMICGKSVVTIKRGQLHTSVRSLAKRWGWSDKKVKTYLKLLKMLEMGQTKGSPMGTTITLVNYGVYQNLGLTKDPTNDPLKEPIEGPTNDPQTININNVNNNVLKKGKKNRPFVNDGGWGEYLERERKKKEAN